MMPILQRGLAVLMSHSRLWLVLALVVVLPALFVFFYISEVSVTEQNLSTVLLSKISTVHDAIESSLHAGISPSLLASELIEDQGDITKFQIVRENGDALVVVYDAFSAEVGTLIETPAPFKSALIEPGTTYVYQYAVDGSYREQAFRATKGADGEQLYIFTEHNFSPIYGLFSSRGDTPIFILAGIFLFIIFLAYWLARQINYEALYQKLSQELVERDTFMSSLVHELRAPLTAMRGYASMIEESANVPAAERGYAERVRLSTTRLVALVNDFLEAARIQSGQLPLTISSFDVVGVVNRVIEAALPNATAKGLAILRTIPDEVITIESDEKRAEQIFVNMLSNAIKYTPKGEVAVLVTKSHSGAIITIADTGAGISAEDQRKLFTPFVRVGDSSQKETVTGTGLGMWITKQMLKQLEGTVEIESIKGVGTHVIITLPLQRVIRGR